MSTRLTLASVRASVARVLSVPETDSRVAEYVTRAQERLLHKGKWVGTYARYRVCVNNSCLTWPREIETIEAAALCDQPVDIRNDWYEFLTSGPGIISADCGPSLTLVDRGDAVAFDDVRGTGKYLSLYADSASDVGKQVLVRYYNSSGGKVYSTVSGETIEGEYLTLVAPPAFVESTYAVMPGGFYGVVKPATVRMVRVYEYDSVALTRRPLAYYEPDETNPVYRRSLVPGVAGSCTGDDDACSIKTIDVVGKLRQRGVSKATDALIIQSAEAIRMMVQAIRKEENDLWDDAAKYELGAVRILREQLAHWMGDGKVAPIRITRPEVYGAGVPNII